MILKGTLYVCAYMVLFFAALSAMVWWDRRRRRARKPFPENLRLLRMPGEYLHQRVIKTDESDMQWVFLVMLLPIVVTTATLSLLARLLRSSPVTALMISLMVFVFCFLLAVRWCHKRLDRRANDYLGFFGERYVAEWLDSLKAKGWWLFHDVPCEGATGKFNLDHVAVGPGGVWVVETKTRRKRPARPGFKEFEVTFDGQQIRWPWCDETDSLTQASDNARWLREWLEEMTGQAFPVAAVVAIPGYSVIERKLGPVRLANPKLLPNVLIGRGNILLEESDIDLLRRQLEHLCRDVEY